MNKYLTDLQVGVVVGTLLSALYVSVFAYAAIDLLIVGLLVIPLFILFNWLLRRSSKEK